MGKLDNLIDSIPKVYQKEYDKIEDILRLSSPKLAKLELITYNINKFSVDSVLDFINSNILPNLRESYFNRVSDLSAQRRLLLAYDLLKNGDII